MLLGASWKLPWKPPLLIPGTVGHQFDVSPVGVRRFCEIWIGDVKVLWRFFGSFCLSGDTFGSHFGRLGTAWELILGLLGSRGASWGAVLA